MVDVKNAVTNSNVITNFVMNALTSMVMNMSGTDVVIFLSVNEILEIQRI